MTGPFTRTAPGQVGTATGQGAWRSERWSGSSAASANARTVTEPASREERPSEHHPNALNASPLTRVASMELNGLLAIFDRAAANLTKLEDVWTRAKPLLPTGPAAGSSPEYDDLVRGWNDLLDGLPRIDGWRIEIELPDMDEVGRNFIDYFEIGEPPLSVYDDIERPDRAIAEYRYRLHRARRRATQKRLRVLTDQVETCLLRIRGELPTGKPNSIFTSTSTQEVEEAVGEIERLLRRHHGA